MAATLNPGASASLTRALNGDAQYVAIVAFYRTPGSGNGWKFVIEKKKLEPDKPLKLELVSQLLRAADAPSQKATQ